MSNVNSGYANELFLAGAGGQGVLQLGRIIAQSAVEEGRFTTYYPSYGAEIRGGVANCTVIISGSEIVSPVVSSPGEMIIMNNQSMVKFSGKLRKNGILIINSSLVKQDDAGGGSLRLFSLPASELAEDIGNIRCANMAMLGAYIEITGSISEETAEKVIGKVFGGKPEIVSANIRAMKEGKKNVQNKKSKG